MDAQQKGPLHACPQSRRTQRRSIAAWPVGHAPNRTSATLVVRTFEQQASHFIRASLRQLAVEAVKATNERYHTPITLKSAFRTQSELFSAELLIVDCSCGKAIVGKAVEIPRGTWRAILGLKRTAKALSKQWSLEGKVPQRF